MRLVAHRSNWICGAATIGLVSLLLGTTAQAQAPMPSEADIVTALTPKPVTRSLSVGAQTSATSEADQAFVRDIQNRRTRSLSTGDRAKLATITSAKPKIDLDIPFEYNSSTIGASARPAVDRLGAALSHPQIKGSTFLIAGHTDAKGSETYNQGLSERRAEAVRRYIVEKYQLPPNTLISVGFGKSRLKNANDPMADENRRVEVTNAADAKTAAR
jgi:outer membrane protein OmpA-like peptidoglycan-associated protein